MTAFKRSMITPHRFRVYQVLQNATEWLNCEQVAQIAHVSERTARDHLYWFCENGLAECAADVKPLLFRILDATEQARDQVARLAKAAEIYQNAGLTREVREETQP